MVPAPALKKIKCIEDLRNEKSYIAAKVLINISATLYDIKPATLMTFKKRRDKNLILLWDKYKRDLALDKSIEFFELKRTQNSVIVLFYNAAFLTEQIYNKKNLNFLSRFGYSEKMNIAEMLNHLKGRYTSTCPHEIGLFLGMPLKDVLGYLQLIPLKCSYCGYWKVYGNPTKQKILFERYRKTRLQVIDLICSGEDPVKILGSV
jgi:hypothetical protein